MSAADRTLCRRPAEAQPAQPSNERSDRLTAHMPVGHAQRMAPLPDEAPPPRLLLPSDRADLRATWHADRAALVISLWHGRVCAASAPLPTEQVARLAGFLVDHLAARAIAADAGAATPAETDAAAARAAPGDAGAAEADAAGSGRDARDDTAAMSETVPLDPLVTGVAMDTAPTDDQSATVPLEVPRDRSGRHLRPAPEPGAGQRAGATIDEAIAAGGAALSAAVDAAKHAWRARRR